MSTIHKDFFGRPIQVGDFFCFAMRAGNSCEMGVGKVISMSTTAVKAWQAKSSWRGNKPELNSRPSNILVPERMVVVDKTSFPEDMVKMLDEAK